MPLAEPEAAAARPSTAVLALVRIGRHFGLTLDPNQSARADWFAGDEPPTALFLRMIERAGLRARAVHIKPGELATLAGNLPAILRLADGKTLLLEAVQERDGGCFALVNDLETGPGVSAIVDEQRLFDAWDGEVIVVKRRWRVTDAERPFGFMWLVGQVVRERSLFGDIGVAAFLLSVLSLAPPMMFIIVIDRVLADQSMSTLVVLGGALVLLAGFETAFGYLRRSLIEVATTRIDGRINLHIYDKLLNLPMSFFERMPTGMIDGKISQIWHIRNFLTGQLFGTLLDLVTLLILLPILFCLNVLLTLMVIFLGTIIMAVYIAFMPALRRKYGILVRAEQHMSAHQVETIWGIKTVKSLSLEGLKRHQRDLRVAEVVEARRSFGNLANLPQTIVTPFEKLIYGGSAFLGCYLALTGHRMTIGVVVAFTMLAGRVTAPMVQLAGLLNALEHARGALGEVASVMNSPTEEGRSGTGLKQPIRGGVVFENVRFRYGPSAAYALDDVSFEVPQGTIFGIMGRSGSGKTTVTRLLQGLNRDYEGLIKLDGMDLREIDLDHLRASIGVVPQENFLFTGTIRENIAAPRPNVGFSDIVRVAQLAGAEEFVERLPRGYETHVEEGAVNFSGGQRQRLAIARALIVDPAILILDEATSALDAESEAIVNANLMRIAKGRTVIIISHRLSSLMRSDAILVLERGRFYDMGRHDELLVRCDIYKTLWYQQNRHLVSDPPHGLIALRSTPAA
jgi:ATP-binding cassette, subfamily B, bacterial HlyB/CyaB